MFESLFATYYGLDWVSMILGFYGAWLIGNRNAFGFVLSAGSVVLAMLTAIIANQYGFIAANLISLVIAFRNWKLWNSMDDQPLEPQT
ncbi:hypothetical protein [Pseudosulfitobacter pseudonitzschiae]|uniref:hypothetical protein n=1 Tax=Pseudosulfitobacter pseudonitzschiae TaxID=1402135 RepID=UPI003B79914B